VQSALGDVNGFHALTRRAFTAYVAQPEWTTEHRRGLAGYVPHAIIGELFGF